MDGWMRGWTDEKMGGCAHRALWEWKTRTHDLARGDGLWEGKYSTHLVTPFMGQSDNDYVSFPLSFFMTVLSVNFVFFKANFPGSIIVIAEKVSLFIGSHHLIKEKWISHPNSNNSFNILTEDNFKEFTENLSVLHKIVMVIIHFISQCYKDSTIF